MSDVYYRIYDLTHVGPTIVCVQDFDEKYFNQDRLLTKEKFESEDEAEMWLTAHRQSPKSPVYWVEVDPVTLNPLGGVCWAYYPNDKPLDGHWIIVRAV